MITELVQSFISHCEVTITIAISQGEKLVLVFQNLKVRHLGLLKSTKDVWLTPNMCKIGMVATVTYSKLLNHL